ncbi:universal stress protein [Streptomyces sp. IBSBF 2435]|uniref:universal stress protein n=1 Tax=Streptomyces sp. IBSBF 2435 TaxID=2903531 RepID=UPI002FDC2C8F
MYKNILAAVDGTTHGAGVLDTVASLAALTGGQVHVIHIRASRVITDGISGGLYTAEDPAEGRQVLDEALARLRAAGITAEGEVDEGLREDLAAILVERADALGSDLIVVGPGHHSGISALLHASVSRGVAKAASVSVLLVRGEA